MRGAKETRDETRPESGRDRGRIRGVSSGVSRCDSWPDGRAWPSRDVAAGPQAIPLPKTEKIQKKHAAGATRYSLKRPADGAKRCDAPERQFACYMVAQVQCGVLRINVEDAADHIRLRMACLFAVKHFFPHSTSRSPP